MPHCLGARCGYWVMVPTQGGCSGEERVGIRGHPVALSRRALGTWSGVQGGGWPEDGELGSGPRSTHTHKETWVLGGPRG